MSSVEPKQHVFASLAQIAQGLGHAHRLQLLEHLGQGERSGEDLSARAGLTLANTSRHLSCSAAPPSLSADVTASASTIGAQATVWWVDCLPRSAAPACATTRAR